MLKLLFGACLFTSCSLLSREGLAASYENLISPSLKCVNEGYGMFKDDINEFKIGYILTKEDNNINFNFYGIENIKENEIVFAVFIDEKGQIIDKRYLDKAPNSVDGYLCDYAVPFYCNMLGVHLYKQKITGPEFTIESKNFLGRNKFLMVHDCDFIRQDGSTNLKAYDEDNSEIDDPNLGVFLTKITPNYYSVKLSSGGHRDYIKIILPKGKEKLLSEEDKIIRPSTFRLENANIGTNALSDGKYADF